MKRKRLTAGMLALLMVLTGFYRMPAKAEAASGSDVVLRFVVASDYHMEKEDDVRGKRLKELFSTAYAYADKQSYKKIDAFVLNGDMVNYGKTEEYAEFKKVMDSAGIAEDTKVLTVMGNHEWWADKNNGYDVAGNKAYLDGISKIDSITEKGLNWSVDINGYTFLGMSQEKLDTFSTESLAWMSEQVDQAATGSKPVFTFQHFAPKQTVYGSFTNNTTWDNKGELTAVYEGHSQVINFSGHSHAPINTPTAINQTTFTQYTTGTGYYFYLDTSATYGAQPPNDTNVAQYTIVEVTADNDVRMLPYDQYTGQFFKELNDSGNDIVYEIDVDDTANWKYTKARADKEQAPYYTSAAKVSVSNITYKSATVSFDQAKDDTGVYAYDISCKSGGKENTYRIFSEWYFSERSSVLSYNMTALEEKTDYTVSVTPVDFFGKTGTPITRTFTTPEKGNAGNIEVGFKAADDTNGWTFTVDNAGAVAGQYYKGAVTIDGKEGHIVFSKQKSGSEFQVWVNFFDIYKDATAPKRNLKIAAGTELCEVSSANWQEMAAGDTLTISNDLYVKNVAGAWKVSKEEADDNVVLDPDAFTKNLVTNGDFETGTNDGWTAEWKNAQIATDQVHGGTYSVKLENVTQGQALTKTNLWGLEAGKIYQVSAWFYVDADTAKLPTVQRALVMAKNSPWSEKESSYDTVPVKAGQWIQYSFTFVMHEGADIAQLLFYTDDIGSFYFDDVTVYRVCRHEYLNHVEKADGCTQPGNIEYWSCKECGKLFSDDLCENELAQSEIQIPATGHQITKVEGKAATCTEEGYEAYWQCSACEEMFSDPKGENPIDQPTAIARHKAVPVKAVAATYTKTGMKAYYQCSCGKLYTDQTCTKATTKAKLVVAKKTLAKPTLKNVTAKSKAALVKWTKKNGVTGYEIQICSDKKCKKIVKKTKVKGATKTSVTVKKLKAKKTYYVRIRTYKTEGKKTAYSAWSAVKKVKTKK